MDFLKRNWFWLLSGGLLLAFGVFFGLWVWTERGANEDLRAEIETQNTTLEGWVKAKDIPSREQAKAYVLHAATLGSELAQSQALLKTGNRWKLASPWPPMSMEDCDPSDFKAAYLDKVRRLLEEDPAAPERKLLFKFLGSRGSFDLADYKSPPSREEILKDGKRLILQLDLVDVLNQSGVLCLPDGGIRFASSTDANPLLRSPLKDDPRRVTHPFSLKVELRFQDLPVLLDRLIASSFNYAVTGLVVEKLEGKDDRETLIIQGFLPEGQRNEVVRATLYCEASEFLFGNKAEKKP